MPTLFEHIVSRRLSQQYEDVATEALAFVVNQEPAAREALVEFLRLAQPGLSLDLVFSTQDSHDDCRPDIAGVSDGEVREVFIENKFWAGLTEAQPVEYLKLLSKQDRATLLTFVVPDARVETVWRELTRRVGESSTVEQLSVPSGFAKLVETGYGPRLAITSWGRVLKAVEFGVAGNPERTSDLSQLRGLCERADVEAFVPLGDHELTDQRIPKRLLQFSDIAELAVAVAREKGVLSTDGLRPTHFFDRTGRYVGFVGRGVGAWFGVDLSSWREKGRTPLWIRFYLEEFEHAESVWPMFQQWSLDSQRVVENAGSAEVWVGVDLRCGIERGDVVADVVEQLAALSDLLARLPASGDVTE
jgi:hypothetical protein